MKREEPEITGLVARFVARARSGDIPHPVLEHAKVALLDWYGVAVAGKDDPLVDKLIRLAEAMGGATQATLVGRGIKKTALQAALINGAASHALDYDDTHAGFLGHPSVTLFPALLALGEWRGKGGIDLLTAYLVGLEVGTALGTFAGLSHYVAGWHGTSTIGHLASAAGCAHLLGLGERRTTYALGIAATQAGGLKRVFGTMGKPFNAGRASQAGLTAALLASDDFTCPEDILEGPQGFFDVLKADLKDDKLN